MNDDDEKIDVIESALVEKIARNIQDKKSPKKLLDLANSIDINNTTEEGLRQLIIKTMDQQRNSKLR